MSELREVIHDYVEHGKFATVVGRGWDMGEETSRREFEDFLVDHIEASGFAEMLANQRFNAAAMKGEYEELLRRLMPRPLYTRVDL